MSFIRREYKFDSTATLMDKRKLTTLGGIRQILKPLLRMMKKRKCNKKTIGEIMDNKYNSSLEDMRNDCHSEISDNDANEALEQRLLEEIDQCEEGAGIFVLNGDQREILPVCKERNFIPVHFARTGAGTFFWTSATTTPKNCKSQQQEDWQVDRWVQA